MGVKWIRHTGPHYAPRGAIPVYALSVAAGIALLIPLLLLPLYRSWMARSWTQVPCTILTSAVQSKSGNSGTTFKIAITYSYVVNGRAYTGNRYDFFPVATIGYRSKAAVARQYAPGTQRHCLVNPHDPAQAVLTRHLGPPLWIGLVPLAFVAAGALGIIHAVRQARARTVNSESTAP
jgi:Protein of unknown function (DUF3592)